MDSGECFFCDKLATLRELPDEDIVWQFAHSVAFLGAWQFYDGYCVLVTRRHATELSQLRAEERRGFLDEMCLLAAAIEGAFRPHKMNYELLGNLVPHLHWHLFPRAQDDPDTLKPVWATLARAENDASQRQRVQTGPRSRAETTAILRRELQKLTTAES